MLKETLVKAENLKKWFPVSGGFLSSLVSRKQLYVRAVDGVSFEVKKGEIFGLAGESGSGKTTTGRMLLRLIEPTSGKVLLNEKDISKIPESKMKPIRKRMQIVFQDPYESLNPRMTISDILKEPLQIQGISNEKELQTRVRKALEDVQLVPPEEYMSRFPHELSGGQRQRVASPEFIVADEPVSMLDVSIRAEVLNLMVDLMNKYQVAFLYITHDLALARHICDRVAVMYLGKIMEMGDVDNVILKPMHPYTQALIAAVPLPDPTSRRIEVVIKGEIPSPINPPSGCRFHTRCPKYIGDICRTKEPTLVDLGKGHMVACHLYDK